MIILGGLDDGGNFLSSGFVYDATTEQSTPLPNDMPDARCLFSAVVNRRFVYVIGGMYANQRVVNTMYRLSLETYEWTTLAPMGTARYQCASVLLDNYVYVFGGYNGDRALASVERYSIAGNNWEDLPDMAEARCGHCAVVAALRNEIYILGGDARVVEFFDTALLEWKTEERLCDMPRSRVGAAAVVLKNRYLVMTGGLDEGCQN